MSAAPGTTTGTGAPEGYQHVNVYTRVIVDEALERGITVEIVDPARGELRLSYGDRTMTTFESLSELTSAVAFRRCDDKLLTRSVLHRAGLAIPAGRKATFDDADVEFLRRHKAIVVKPARGEQGWGITVDVTTEDALHQARERARSFWPAVLLEEHRVGDDVRAVVIDGVVVAAAVRRPAAVTGDGHSTVAQLINRVDRRHRVTTGARRSNGSAAASGRSGPLPLAEAAAGMVRGAGWDLESVLPPGEVVVVSPTANVHNGATIEDVTSEIHPGLAELAVAAADAIGIPVAGIDLIVDAVNRPDGTVIEVNEQPGLANHEPQPTAARFVDLLFPESAWH